MMATVHLPRVFKGGYIGDGCATLKTVEVFRAGEIEFSEKISEKSTSASAEEPRTVPSTDIRRLIAACNSNPGVLMPPSGLHGHLYACGTHIDK